MARWRALLTGYRECVLEASVHSRRLVLVIYTAPDTQQAHDEVSSTSIYLSINGRLKSGNKNMAETLTESGPRGVHATLVQAMVGGSESLSFIRLLQARAAS